MLYVAPGRELAATFLRSRDLSVPGVNEIPRNTSPKRAARIGKKYCRGKRPWIGVLERIQYDHEFVRVCALIALPADVRRNSPDSGGSNEYSAINVFAVRRSRAT